MGIETIVKAYLVTFWPREYPISTKTMIAYSAIDAVFEEDRLDEEGSEFRYNVKDMAMKELDMPIDKVKAGIRRVHREFRQELAGMGLFRCDPERRRVYIMQLETMAAMDNAREKTAVKMVEDYLADKSK